MTERERLYTAKLYMEKLSNGINPFDGEDVPDDSLLNDVYLCRAFVYITKILQEVIDNNCEVSYMPTKKKVKFSITDTQRAEISLSEEPVGISTIATRVTRAIDPSVKNIPSVKMTAWLESQGLLERREINGEIKKVPTNEGSLIGISAVEAITRDGRKYQKNLYDINAQAFLIANLEEISLYNK